MSFFLCGFVATDFLAVRYHIEQGLPPKLLRLPEPQPTCEEVGGVATKINRKLATVSIFTSEDMTIK